MNIEEAARLFRSKGLALTVTYKRLRTGEKTHGWKWVGTVFSENGCHRHIQASRLYKVLDLLLKIEGITNTPPPIDNKKVLYMKPGIGGECHFDMPQYGAPWNED